MARRLGVAVRPPPAACLVAHRAFPEVALARVDRAAFGQRERRRVSGLLVSRHRALQQRDAAQ